MTKSLPLMILTAAALVSGVAGAATRTVPGKPATAAMGPARPVMKATAMKTAATKRAVAIPATRTVAPGARMVSTKTATGKAVTYNCAKAGNATKKACK